MAPKRIAFFGSSSVYGTADSEVGGFVNRFRLWYESIDAHNRVYSLGIWGERTRSLIDRIGPEAARRRPHLIMIYPGYNDCRRKGAPDAPNAASITEFQKTVRELISSAQAIAETVVVTGFPFDEARTMPYGNTDSYYLLGDAVQYIGALAAIAEERGVRVLDFFAKLQNQDMKPLLASDGLHCNAKGHELLFEMTREFVREAFHLARSSLVDRVLGSERVEQEDYARTGFGVTRQCRPWRLTAIG